MKKYLPVLLSFMFLFCGDVFSQVAKKIVVEHFTNTWCSTCANRNPGFYANLNTQTNILHLAIHPSSPYPGCILNQHNIAENDGRTNYYGVYGSTPRLVIQGSVISSSANYSSAAIFSPFQSQTSPAAIRIDQTKFGSDSIRTRVVTTTVSAHSLGNLRLFVALAEDTVFYTGPNGESQHYDVFRKSLTGVQGTLINLPSAIGDSVVFSAVSASNSAWDFNRIYSLIILQNESDKAVIQAESVSANEGVVTGVLSPNKTFKIFPNPAGDILNIHTGNNEIFEYSIFNILGKQMILGNTRLSSKVDLSDLHSGHYFIRIISGGAVITRSFIKQ